MNYAIISTLVAIAGIGATVAAVKHYRAKVAEVSAELNEAIRASQQQRKEIEQLRHVIKAEQEVIRETAETKREIRSHSNPADRANAAADLMRDLAGGGDGNGDDSPAA